MKKRLFTYAVILHTKKKTDDGALTKQPEEFESTLIIEPTNILAKNEKDVVFKVTRLIPEEHASDSDNVEILIRPF